MKKAKLVFYFGSKKEAKIISESVNPEIIHKIPKTRVDASVEGSKFFLTIEAEDLSSLRAACNSYIRWIDTAYTVEQKIE